VNPLGLKLCYPSKKDLLALAVLLPIVALAFTSLHFLLDVSPIVLRKAFFIFSAAMMLGPFGISLGQNGWRVLPIYFAIGAFAAIVL